MNFPNLRDRLFRRGIDESVSAVPDGEPKPWIRSPGINVKVVGVGGAGGNAIKRMVKRGVVGTKYLTLNTDVQALRQLKGIPTFAIGPKTTGGMGSGGRPEIGRKAIKESQDHLTKLLQGCDMVFITAGMGGGTGTGAASVVADIARKQGALTVGVVTMPFGFEGNHRKQIALDGLRQLEQKVDTLITVENNRLLSSLKGDISLEGAFQAADEVLRQGVQGISEIINVPGLINVDFADVKALMSNGGPSFMAIGEGKGRWAAIEAAQMAISNPLFDAPLDGATGILLNVKGGPDLSLGQVHEVADVVRRASNNQANVIFGVVHDKKLNKRVTVTIVATGIGGTKKPTSERKASGESAIVTTDHVDKEIADLLASPGTNGHAALELSTTKRLL